MNSGPTPISAGLAGTPLSKQTSASQQNTAHMSNAKGSRSDAISDTLETSDREADGRQPLETNEPTANDSQTGERLDLTG